MVDEPPLITDFGEVTLERLEQGVKDAAWIVETYGEEYVPIFERLSADLYKMKRIEGAFDRAMAYPNARDRQS